MMRIQTKAMEVDTEGTWAQHPSGARFLIARAGNSKFLSAIDKYERPFRKERNRGTLATEIEIDIQCRGMAEGILLGWSGIKDEDGNDFSYNKDNAFALLRHNSDLREYITDYATDKANYRSEDIAETAKK